jgi:tetratricopeptide (TPR) repeat protein
MLDASQRALDADSTRSYVWIARSIAIRELEPLSRRNQILALQHAIALDSGNADAWHYLGVALEDSLQPADAVDAFRHALRIDPTHRQALGFIAHHFMWARQYDSALAWGNRGKSIDPQHILIRQGLAPTELMVGDTARARDDFHAEMNISQGPDEGFGVMGLAAVAMHQGRRAEADSLMQLAAGFADLNHPTVHEAAWLAAGYGVVGEKTRAIALLKRYEPRGDMHFQLHLQRDPLLDPLRSMPEFRALLVRKDAILPGPSR